MSFVSFIMLFSLLLVDIASLQYCTDGTGSAPYGTRCVFPFLYKGKEYRNCTAVDNPDGIFWCSTTADYDRYNKSWGGCQRCDSRSEHVQQSEFCTVGGNAPRGSRCVFPFVNAGVEFNKCINADDGASAWCATTNNFDRDGIWGDCVRCSGGTMSPIKFCADGSGSAPINTPCVFPFTYMGVEYNECMTVDWNGSPWCATTANDDKGFQWGVCMHCSPEVKPNGGPSLLYCADGAGTASSDTPCYFPFKYKGRWHRECTNVDISDGFWCGTTANLDEEMNWGMCKECGPSGKHLTRVCTTGGTAPHGSKCHFPFVFENREINHCIANASHHPGSNWCSITANLDQDGLWGECVPCTNKRATPPVPVASRTYCADGSGTAPMNTPCVFPFWAHGVAYEQCTTETLGRSWCSTTADYDKDALWGECIPCPQTDCEGHFEFFPCSKSCGGGSDFLVYRITANQTVGGAPCPYPDRFHNSSRCNTHPCPPPKCSLPVPLPAGYSYLFGTGCDGPTDAQNCDGVKCSMTDYIGTVVVSCPAEGSAFNLTGCVVAPRARLDCTGHWINTSCTQSCGGGASMSIFMTTVLAENGGRDCANLNGSTFSTVCNPQPCNFVTTATDGVGRMGLALALTLFLALLLVGILICICRRRQRNAAAPNQPEANEASVGKEMVLSKPSNFLSPAQAIARPGMLYTHIGQTDDEVGADTGV